MNVTWKMNKSENTIDHSNRILVLVMDLEAAENEFFESVQIAKSLNILPSSPNMNAITSRLNRKSKVHLSFL